MNGLGARIAAARVAMSLSQGELANLLGVTQAAVSRWETDQREPDLAQLLALAGVLLVPVQTLLGQQYEHPDTEQALTWWSGWRQGWLACAGNVRAAAALRPDLMPPQASAPDSEPGYMQAAHGHQVRGGGAR